MFMELCGDNFASFEFYIKGPPNTNHFDLIPLVVLLCLCFVISKLGSCKERCPSHKRSRNMSSFNLFPFFFLGNIFLSFYFIYTHLLSNHTLYVGCSSDRTISSSPQIISRILSTRKRISFILEFLDFFVYRELWKNNCISCKCWKIFLNTLEFWL